MTTPSTTSPNGPLVLVGSGNGLTVIPTATPLVRLNYYDGKFLRAADLTAEQAYLRSLVALSNRAGGHGIAHGLDVARLGSGSLAISPGLAVDPEGRVLLLTAPVTVGLAELIEKTRQTPAATLAGGASAPGAAGFGPCTTAAANPPSVTLGSDDLYVITVAHAEALCGEEDVYGKVCSEACITSTDRPFRLEGIILRARPLPLTVPLPTSGIGLTLTHWRSRVASAWFEQERQRVGSLISKAGLESDAWCHGAVPEAGSEVPLAVVGRAGTAIQFLDLWTVRRERIDTPARRYWQWRMAMRPWDVFLAHVLQFQCQLNAALGDAPVPGDPDDPCRRARALIEEATTHFESLRAFYAETTQRLARLPRNARERVLAESSLPRASLTHLTDFGTRLTRATEAFKALPADRLLIRGGIIELPSAGYLPVLPGSTLTVNQQVRRLLGEGVDLRFCIVRPDYVAHALEEAQHLERISLVAGLDNPARKQEVDILVPFGQVAPDRLDRGRFYEMRLNLNFANLAILAAAYAALRPADTAATAAAAAGEETPTPPATATPTPAAATVAVTVNASLERLRQYLALLERDTKNALLFEFPAGAARAESTPEGALAFSFAGTTGTFQWGTPAAATPEADADRPETGPANAATGLFNRRTRLASRAQTEARASIWVSLDLDGDPSELPAGDAVSLRAETYLLLTLTQKSATGAARETESVVLHLAFTGDLQVEDNDRRSGPPEVREVKALLSGRLTFSTVSDGEEHPGGSVHLSEHVVVLRTESAHGPSYRLELPEPSLLQPLVAALNVRRDWSSATQAEVLGSITFRALRARTESPDRDLALNAAVRPFARTAAFVSPSSRTTALQQALAAAFADGRQINRQAFRAWQTVRPEVLDPTHPAHESAIAAVRGIGTALGSPRFADLAAKRLFPAPAAPTGLQILATLDWVLFHRRRDRHCHREQPAPQVQTRHYALYHAALTGDQTLADLVRALGRGAATPARLPLDFVQVVEFGAGIHAVLSPHSQVQASWRQDVGPDAGLVEGGLIASRGLAAAEGERLAQDRLESLVEVIAPVTPPVPQPAYHVLNRLPDGYAVPGNDGILVVATRPATVRNCHTVIGVESPDFLPRLTEAATAGRLAEALEKIRRDLGRVVFTANTPDAADLAAVRTAWNALDFGTPSGALVVSVAGDANAAVYPPQSRALLEALDGSGSVATATAPQATGLGECPAVTLLAGSVRFRSALLLHVNWDNGEHFITATAGVPQSPMQFRNDVPQGDALANFIAGLGPNRPVRGVTVAVPTGAPDAGAPTRLAAVVQALIAGGKGDPNPNRKVTEALSTHDRQQLANAGIAVDGFDDIIFLEINAG